MEHRIAKYRLGVRNTSVAVQHLFITVLPRTLSISLVLSVLLGCCSEPINQVRRPRAATVTRNTESVSMRSLPQSTKRVPNHFEPCAVSEEEDVAAPSIVVSAVDKTPLVGPAPFVRILEPREGQLILKGPIRLRLKVNNWPIEPQTGNYIQVK